MLSPLVKDNRITSLLQTARILFGKWILTFNFVAFNFYDFTQLALHLNPVEDTYLCNQAQRLFSPETNTPYTCAHMNKLLVSGSSLIPHWALTWALAVKSRLDKNSDFKQEF